MKVKELKELVVGKYNAIEVYEKGNYNNGGITISDYHTDVIGHHTEDYSDEDEVLNYMIMDEEDYNCSVSANDGLYFNDIYDEGDKILVILLDAKEE